MCHPGLLIKRVESAGLPDYQSLRSDLSQIVGAEIRYAPSQGYAPAGEVSTLAEFPNASSDREASCQLEKSFGTRPKGNAAIKSCWFMLFCNSHEPLLNYSRQLYVADRRVQSAIGNSVEAPVTHR